jgi:aspartyl/asparaginyl beta-hydroxylase (cupin superfamily)
LLIPIQAPEGAVTLIGHEAAAYPEGQCWTGDFCFPHQVENPTDRDRIVLSLDVTVTDGVRALFPSTLVADPARRDALAGAAQNLFQVWRSDALAIATP